MKNYTNKRHGDYHVTTKTGENNDQGYRIWNAYCVYCSKRITLTTQQISMNRHLRCGCWENDKNTTEGIALMDTFGKLTVSNTSKDGFVCTCECGETVTCTAYDLLYHMRSCGCAIVKDGSYIDGDGYRYIRKPGHPRASQHGYVREHIVVMEDKLGRSLREGEVVHHINGIKDDNRPENLWVFDNNTLHMRFHHLLKNQNKELLTEFPVIMKEEYPDVMEVL